MLKYNVNKCFVNVRFFGFDWEGFGLYLFFYFYFVFCDIFIKMLYIKNKKFVGFIVYMSNNR